MVERFVCSIDKEVIMDHFYEKVDSQNWFTSPNLYKMFVEKCPIGGKIVEVGCWKGKSSAFLVVEAINSNKKINIFCVDTWLGNDEIPKDDIDWKNGTVYEKFISNMKPVLGKFNIIRSPSTEASLLFEDESLDIVFIDASHHYIDVKNDIKCWLPKVKQGGILAGHDLQFNDVRRAVSEMMPHFKDAGEQCWIYYK